LFQRDVCGKKEEIEAVSLWRLSLPTCRNDGEDEGEVTFGSPVCILSKLPQCQLKTFGSLAVLWTVNCADAGGDFAFVIGQGCSTQLIETDSDGAVMESDFDASSFDEWMRMRILDCLRAEAGSLESSEKYTAPSRQIHSPWMFLFDSRSRALVMVRKDGSVYLRLHHEHEKDVHLGSESLWQNIVRLNLSDDKSHLNDSDERRASCELTTLKQETYLLTSIGRELKVYNLSKGGAKLDTMDGFAIDLDRDGLML